jgi:hypothetical protein
MFKTGDILKNIERLRSELKSIKYPEQIDQECLKEGNPLFFLPILHYTVLSFSKYFAQYLLENDYELFSKSDKDFIAKLFLAMIHLFNFKPSLNPRQFFSSGYAEAKVIFCLEVLKIVKSEHNTLVKKYYSLSVNAKNLSNKTKGKFNDSFRSNKSQNEDKKSKPRQEYSENNKTFEVEKFDSDNDVADFTPSPKFNDDEKINYDFEKEDYTKKLNHDYQRNKNYSGSRSYTDYSEEEPYNKDKLNYNYPDTTTIPPTKSKKQEIKNNFDFSQIVEIINSLSNSVKDMTSRIESFKTNIENRVEKVEAEVILLKNKLNLIESNLNANILNNNSEKINDKNFNINNQSLINNESNSNFFIPNESNEHIFSFSEDHQGTMRMMNEVKEVKENLNKYKKNIEIQSNDKTENKSSIFHSKKENDEHKLNIHPQEENLRNFHNKKDNQENNKNYNTLPSHNKDSKINNLNSFKSKINSVNNGINLVNNYSQNNNSIMNKIPTKILNEIEDTDSIIQRVANRFKETQRLLNEFK